MNDAARVFSETVRYVHMKMTSAKTWLLILSISVALAMLGELIRA